MGVGPDEGKKASFKLSKGPCPPGVTASCRLSKNPGAFGGSINCVGVVVAAGAVVAAEPVVVAGVVVLRLASIKPSGLGALI